MEGEAVIERAAPFQRLAGGGKLQAGEIDDWAVGGVFAGDPFGIVEIGRASCRERMCLAV